MSLKFHLVLFLLALSGCYQTHSVSIQSAGNSNRTLSAGDTDLTTALLTGNEGSVHKLTDDIIAGKRPVMKAELSDEREVAPNVLVRTTYENHDYQLGVSTVSEYTLCVLQIKTHTSSESILGTDALANREQCSKTKPCEVCNAQAFPVSEEVKRHLIDYWVSKLKLK